MWRSSQTTNKYWQLEYRSETTVCKPRFSRMRALVIARIEFVEKRLVPNQVADHCEDSSIRVMLPSSGKVLANDQICAPEQSDLRASKQLRNASSSSLEARVHLRSPWARLRNSCHATFLTRPCMFAGVQSWLINVASVSANWAAIEANKYGSAKARMTCLLLKHVRDFFWKHLQLKALPAVLSLVTHLILKANTSFNIINITAHMQGNHTLNWQDMWRLFDPVAAPYLQRELVCSIKSMYQYTKKSYLSHPV